MTETITATKNVQIRHSKVWISQTVEGLKQNINNGLLLLAASNIREYGLAKEDLKPLIVPVCMAIVEGNLNENNIKFVMQVFDLKPADVRCTYMEQVINLLRKENIDIAIEKLAKLNCAIEHNELLRKDD